MARTDGGKPRSILYEGSLAESYARHLLEEALFFDEDSVGPVHHHLADGIVEDEVLDGLQER